MAPGDTASSKVGSSTPSGLDRGIAAGQRDATANPDPPSSTGNRSVDNRTVTAKPPLVKGSDDPTRSIGNRHVDRTVTPRPPPVKPSADLPRSIGNRYVVGPVVTRTPASVKQSWTLLASPGSKSRARAMDALETLTDPELIKRRDQEAVKAVKYFSTEQQAALHTLEDIEFLASTRGIEPMKPRREEDSRHPHAVVRRLNVRVHLEEGVRLEGSFKKALEGFGPSGEIGSDIDHFTDEARRFETEFRSQAVSTALRMLNESQRGIQHILDSYGLPHQAALNAANRLANGSDLDKEVATVIQVATASERVDADPFTTNRVSLVRRARRLRRLQQVIAQRAAAIAEADARSGAGSRAGTPVNVDKLNAAWVAAMREHPVLAAFRRGGDADEVMNIDLAPLATAPIEGVMKAVVKELLPKLREIRQTRNLLQGGPKALDPLSLPAVVALTRTNMFIPAGSLRDGIARDLVNAAGRPNPVWLTFASFVLVLIAFVPSAGASIAIPIGAAGIMFEVYSSAQIWEYYRTQKSLSNTDLDLARSLSAEDPSLASFVMSLAAVGFELLPLVGAFRKALRMRGLAAGADDAGEALLRAGAKTPPVKGPSAIKKSRGPVPEIDATNTLGKPVSYESPKDLQRGLDQAFTQQQIALRQAIAAKKVRHGTEELNPMMVDLLEGFRYKGKRLTLNDLGRVNLRRVVTADGNPLDPDTRRLLKLLPRIYKAVRDPKLLKRVAGEVWQFAAKEGITTREALEALVGGDVRRVWIRSEEQFHREILLDSPFIDLAFSTNPHGAYTHMFQELVVSRALGTKWGAGGRRFRALVAQLKGQGPEIFETLQSRRRDFWAAAWDALFDDMNGEGYLNHPETLGDLLHTHLGLPMWKAHP